MFPLYHFVKKSITAVTDLVSQARLADVTKCALYDAFSLLTTSVELGSPN